MELNITTMDPGQGRVRPVDEQSLGFGKYFSDHMFRMDYQQEQGWLAPRIEPYGPVSLDPAAIVLHYAQQIFDGMKAYRRTDGGIQLFRPRDYLTRMNRSARRICMPEVDVPFVLDALRQLLLLDESWVPRSRGSSLYIRPNMIATDPFLGVKVSPQYLFYIMTGPVGAYYTEGFKPTRILVSDKYVRAVVGGVGDAKTGGNYAASLLAAEEAYAKGFTQVLWLDACERKYVEEVGTSNIFFVLDGKVLTPPLTGSILPGITRDSVLQLVRDWNMPVEERAVSMDEIVDAIRSGKMEEIFATGTAAVISPVGEIGYKDQVHAVGDGKVGSLSQRLYDEIQAIQYGDHPDPHGWAYRVEA